MIADIAPDNSVNGISVIGCNPYLEQLNAVANFTYPDLKLIGDPTPDEASVQYFSNVSAWSVSPLDGGYDTSAPWGSLIDSVNTTNLPIASAGSFFQAMFQVNNVTPPSIIGPQNTENLLYQTNKLYRFSVAQLVNNNMRLANANGAPPFNTTGVLTDSNVTRLYQSKAAANALTGLLAAMILFSLPAVLTFWPTRILTKPPTSIAARASLLVDSKRLGEMLEGKEVWSQEELIKKGGFEACEVRLGYFEEDGVRRYGVHVVDENKENE